MIFARTLLPALCMMTASLLSFAQASTTPVPVIFDTDMGPDYDDVGAITLLHAFADQGRIDILATMASTRYEGVAAVLDVLNTYFRKPDIPIGVPKGDALELKNWQHWTDTLIARYPHNLRHNAEAEDAVQLYRKILSRQPDHSMVIITTGFLTNLSDLLRSAADVYSPLDGAALVKRKVKRLVSMGGKFPEGKEFNIMKDAAASRYVFENWPTPVWFSGFEIGEKIRSGLPLVHNKEITGSPVKDVFSLCIPMAKEDSAGRMSWDETAVLAAVLGYKPFYTLKEGKIRIAEDGSNTWDDHGKGQYYLVENQPPATVQQLINKLMMHQPR